MSHVSRSLRHSGEPCKWGEPIEILWLNVEVHIGATQRLRRIDKSGVTVAVVYRRCNTRRKVQDKGDMPSCGWWCLGWRDDVVT